jgi:hypothetical protein
MTSRRKFIQIVPVASLSVAGVSIVGTALLTGCGKADAPAPAAAPAPAPTPAPAPAPAAPAASLPMLDEKDPTAVGLGYVADAAQVDKAKYASFVAGSACSSCQLYQGAAGAESGPCSLYPGKAVAAKAWCSAYVKKA